MNVSIWDILEKFVVLTCRKGDYYRYLAEFKTGTERKEAADESLKAYQVMAINHGLDLLMLADKGWL